MQVDLDFAKFCYLQFWLFAAFELCAKFVWFNHDCIWYLSLYYLKAFSYVKEKLKRFHVSKKEKYNLLTTENVHLHKDIFQKITNQVLTNFKSIFSVRTKEMKGNQRHVQNKHFSINIFFIKRRNKYETEILKNKILKIPLVAFL